MRRLTLAALVFVAVAHHGATEVEVAQEPDTKNILLVTGCDYPGHKWAETAPVLAEALGRDGRLRVRVVEDPGFLANGELSEYDAIVIHFMDWERPDPGPNARANLEAFVKDGGGLVMVHFACGAFQEWPEFRDLAGRVWDPQLRGHDPHGAFQVDIVNREHPVTRWMEPFTTVDELYTCLAGDRPVEMLATARSKVDGKDYPMAFTFAHGGGRVFHCPLGHDVAAFENRGAAELFRRGCAWAAGLPPKPKKVVFIAGPPSHGAGSHEWGKDAALLKESVDGFGGPIATDIHVNGWPADPHALDDADTIVLLCDGSAGHPLGAEGPLNQVRGLAQRGCGLVFLHYAVAPPEGAEPEFLEWIGGYWERDYSQNPISAVEASPARPGHPICRGWKPFTARDEYYFQIRFREDDGRLTPVMTAGLPVDAPKEEVIAWAVEREDGGRGFGFTGGHFHESWRLQPLRKMILNAILWSAHLEVPPEGVGF